MALIVRVEDYLADAICYRHDDYCDTKLAQVIWHGRVMAIQK